VKEFLVYTAARLAIFLTSYVLVVLIYLWISGAEQIPLIWPFLVAVLISAIASVYFLRRQREAFALVIQQRADRTKARFEEARAKEDHADEQARSQEGAVHEAAEEPAPHRAEDQGPEDGNRG
jgi:TRAP-type C4-dicarboxylate transport system permease small subunit